MIAVVPPVVVNNGGTNIVVIAPDNTNAVVLFDGSQSWDPEGDALSYEWSEGPAPEGSQVPVPPGKKRSSKKASKAAPGECVFGKVAKLTLQYTGNVADSHVMVVQKNGDVIFDGTVQPGESFTFMGTGKNGEMGSEIAILLNGQVNGGFHTGGNEPLGPGAHSGEFLVTEGFTNKDGELCRLAPPPLDTTVAFGNGVVAQRTLHLGQHTIILRVSDNDCSDEATAIVEVITPGQAVERCIELLNSLNLGRKESRPLIDSLKKAASEFDKGKIDQGIKKLEAFIKKLDNEKKVPAAAATVLRECVENILEALE